MAKLKLSDWASMAEIGGTAVVIVSLAFVVYSINQNTAALRANNENFLYQITIDTGREVARNPELASLVVRFKQGEKLTEIELEQYRNHLWNQMNNWEIAYDRYADGLLTEDQWHAWDRAFQPMLGSDLPVEWWPDWKRGHGDGFQRHIEELMSDGE